MRSTSREGSQMRALLAAVRNHFVDGESASPTLGNVFDPYPGWKSASGN